MITRALSTPQTTIGYLNWKDSGRTEQLEVGEFVTLGRDSVNQVVLDDEWTSGRHARIERKNDGFLIRDMRSRNGTYVNGTRVVEAVLNDGDRIRIGQTEIGFAAQKVENPDPFALSSRNPCWNLQLQRLPNIALSQFPVLLTGPSGSGKDVLAQVLHQRSARRNGPFVSVNCSALTESLVESELFGHVRGSFTGATSDRKGAFEAARGGTLFLDEVGDLPLVLQPKLLRALENSEIQAVGADRPIQTDVRIIAATHKDLKRKVFDESFRADLYFRLHVVQIQTPALSERMEDFEDLIYMFARQMRVRFSVGAIERLKRHSFPGNIRELRNIVARAKAYCGSEEVNAIDVVRFIDVMPETSDTPVVSSYRPSRSVIKEIEVEMIKSRLVANRGNQRKTAAELGIPKSTLHDRIRTYGINLEELLKHL
ncbi:MAG: sigma 54-interacting transcriptional regulator [Bdellovibrionales bacterium]|nr:sigma 54-interacting transcriptional regulator [Bdellovibrionales bacterium]